MKFFYIYPEQILQKNAREISILNTFYEMSKIVENAKFITTNLNCKIDDLNDYFDLNLKNSDFLFLNKKILFFQSTKIFNLNLKKIINDKNNIDAIFYTRHIKIADFILKYKKDTQKLFYEAHELFYLNNPKNKDKIFNMEKNIFENSSGIIYNNSSIKKETNKIFKSTKNELIAYNGVKSVLPKDIFTNFNFDNISYFGSFLLWKGLDLLLNFVKINPSIKLFLYGNDESKSAERLKKYIDENDLQARVVFMGFIHQKNVLKKLFDNENLLIIPSIASVYSPFSTPLKVYEYLAGGNIIIAPDFNPVKEIIIDGKNGFLYKNCNLQSLNEIYQKLKKLDNKELQKISYNARMKADELLWNKRAEKIISFIKEA